MNAKITVVIVKSFEGGYIGRSANDLKCTEITTTRITGTNTSFARLKLGNLDAIFRKFNRKFVQ